MDVWIDLNVVYCFFRIEDLRREHQQQGGNAVGLRWVLASFNATVDWDFLSFIEYPMLDRAGS